MNRDPDRLAPRQREAALRELAAQLNPRATEGPREPTTGWDDVCRLAAEHRLLPAVWSALAARGVRPLPRALRAISGDSSPLAVLEDAHAENALRSADLRAQGEELLAALSDAGIAAMPIKGLHLLLAGWLPDPAARTMVDIDVLVHPAAIPDACRVAHACGYRPLAVVCREEGADHEVAPLVLPGRSGSLELHRSTLMSRHAAVLPDADLWAHASAAELNGRAQALPNPTHAFALLIAHAQLQDDGYRLLHLPLRALYDFALLNAQGRDGAVDWGEVRERFARVGKLRCLSGFVAAVEDLFGMSAPLQLRGGRSWSRATRWAVRHPTAGLAYREAALLPRALSAARMARLYDAHGRGQRTVARLRHASRGGARRLAGWNGAQGSESQRTRTSRILTVTPTESTLGAVVTGADLGRLDDRTWRQIEAAFHEFALLVFPGQCLSNDEQVAFGRRFGEIEQSIELPSKGIIEVAARAGDGSWITNPSDSVIRALTGAQEWHTDSSCRPVSSKASLLSADVVPRRGGETEFADLRAAYDALSPEEKARFDSLTATHIYGYWLTKLDSAAHGSPEVSAQVRAEHDLVKLHPVTKRRALFIDRHVAAIRGMDDESAQALASGLLTFACRPPRVLCHRWRVGDIAVWDNRCVLHRARGWDWREARVMRHTRIAGDPVTEAAVAELSRPTPVT
jgi:alpha-ketoglutarate-dependent taurine dioxygenase